MKTIEPTATRSVVRHLADALVKSWWTMVAGGCLGAATALLVLHEIPRKYEAKATILVSSAPAAGNAATFGERVLGEDQLRDLVERVLGSPQNDERNQDLMRGVRARLVIEPAAASENGATLVDVRYRDKNPGRASAVVNTLLDVYLGFEASLPGSSESDGLPRISDTSEMKVVERASVPTASVAPQRIPVILLGVLAGCTIFVGPLLARRFLDPLIATTRDLRGLSEIPVLARIPRISGPGTRNQGARRLAKNVGLSLLSAAVLLAAVAILRY